MSNPQTPEEWLKDFELTDSDTPDDVAQYKREVILPIMRRAVAENEPGYCHHGCPELTRRDIGILDCVTLWMTTAAQFNSWYRNGWVPRRPDFVKSRLFWRLRSGKAPLPTPPPTAFSCPWYEVVEEDVPHWCNEVFVSQNKRDLVVCQCHYKIEEQTSLESWIVSFNEYRFKVWREAGDDGLPSWKIQIIKKEPENNE